MSFEHYHETADYIRANIPGDVPKLAFVLGSGLDGVADAIEDASVFDYADLPHFPTPTVSGHSGRMLIGKLSGVPVICLRGRVHGYEGHGGDKLGYAVRTLWALGVDTLVLTNAAGSLNAEAGPGSLMAITDHINFTDINPLVGLNDDRIGPRFVDLTEAWHKGLTTKLHQAATALDIKLHEGTYLMCKGPNFETPAEIRAFRTMGADAVGMSTVPECLTARHAGIKVCGVSSITNLAAGMTGNELTHDETMEFGQKAGVDLTKLLKEFVKLV